MMPESIAREEILDLLSRGKITIDEAVGLLNRTSAAEQKYEQEAPVFKAEIVDDEENVEVARVKEPDPIEDSAVFKNHVIDKDNPRTRTHEGGNPRWLRILVADLDSGKNKVSVNVPFAMVKFGLGVARVFSPEIEGVNLEEVSEMFSHAGDGLLVDVEDVESNEHVQIYLD
ncbi:MAG: hypothetical protein R3293_05140 [Candidatus Promineifilaceae bacterium]|nr:hypothetical protein [Candidatus Promineifilaceae bacterium]